MMPEEKVRALKMVIQSYRYTSQPEPFWTGAVRTLVARFNAALSKIVLEGDLSAATSDNVAMGLKVPGRLKQTARREKYHALRIDLASQLIGREIKSFNDLLGGEIKALMEEPDLPEILSYLLQEQSK